MSTKKAELAAFAALVLAPLCLAQPPCSEQTIRGTWVDQSKGTIVMTLPGTTQPVPAPVAGLGVFTIDNQGNFTARATSVIAGQVMRGHFAGTFEVNPDCTATARFTLQLDGAPAPMPGIGVEKLFILKNGNEMHSTPTNGLFGKPAMLETLRRISHGTPQCSPGTVYGTYGGIFDGLVIADVAGQTQPVPTVFVGAAAVDYHGGVTGGYTVSVGGQLMEMELVNSTIQVNDDCTGTAHFSLQAKGSGQPLPGQGIDEIVVLNNGDEIVGLPIQGFLGKPVGLDTMKRISMVPVTPVW